MDEDAVSDYVNRSQSLLQASPQMDEENTKTKLILPFLDLLGWDIYSTEVKLEYTVQMATQQSRVDFALMIGDAPVVFVEAKPARSELTNKDITQLRSYMRQELDVDWGVLTNGETFELLGKFDSGSSDAEVSITSFKLEEMAEKPEMLEELFSKEAIQSGHAEVTAQQIRQANRAISRLDNRETAIANRLTEILEEELGDTPLDMEAQNREFLNDLRDTLEKQRRFITEAADEVNINSKNNKKFEHKENRVAGTIARSEIGGEDDDRVAVFPTRKSGLTFLFENNAWGFVRVGREFEHVAMYVAREAREVRYIGRAKDVVDPEAANLARDPLEYIDRNYINDKKIVVKFEEGSLYRLENPIPYETKYPQSLRYTTLGEFRNADTTDDLF